MAHISLYNASIVHAQIANISFPCKYRLKLALPWLVQAFSGFLIPEQLLYVWDLILGFDTLNVLPLLAAAIFSLRRDNLRRVETQEAADAICRDLSTIKVIPLLQMALAQHDHYVPPTAS